jgi:hypothetical protein
MNSTPRKPTAKKETRAQSQPVPKEAESGILIASELEAMLHLAFVNAREQRHQYVAVEHLFFSLLDVPSTRETLTACGANIDELKSKVTVYLDENTPIVEGSGEIDTQPTLGFQRVIQRAILRVQAETPRGRQVNCNDVLIALFGEKDSHAVYYLHQQGITRLDVVNFLTHGLRRNTGVTTKHRPVSEVADQLAGREFVSLVSEVARPFVAVADRAVSSPKLFISYSHVDTPCLERLLIHLKPLERNNTIVCWSDKRVRTGDKWKAEIEANLNDAVIAILLVSADFLASDFVVNNELPPLLIKADSKGLRILPVILKPCGFRRDPILSTFQSANDPATPLLGMTAMEQEALYDRIAEEVAKEVTSRRAS